MRPMPVMTRHRFGAFLLAGLALALPACADAPGPVAATTAASAPPSAAGNLCAAAEITLFRCPAARGRQIAICASGSPGTPDARAQYRFGRPGQVELAYPTDASTGPQALLASHYSRAGVDRLSIRFETPDAEYVVYDWLETGEPRRNGVDVTMTQPAGKEIHVACTGPVTIDPPAIEARLRCDSESALATCD